VSRSIVIALVALAALAFSASAGAKLFTLGVTAGEINAKTAKLWAHTEKPGKYFFEVSQSKRFRDVVFAKKVKAKSGNDNTIQVTAKKLKPDERYYYEACNSKGTKCSQVGKFETAPKASSPDTIRFAYTGDTDAQPAPGTTTPFYNNFEAFASMLNEKNDFNVHFGDTIYSDSEVPGAGALASTVAEKWAKYRQNLGLANLVNLRKSTGFYSHWDDHEFIDNFSLPEDGNAIYQAGVKAFTDYAPVNYSSDTGLYREFRWGKNLDLFFLDERSFRSAAASAGGVCDNPSTPGAVDLAPTAPPATRATFSLIIPSLANPVSQQCLDTINDPNRTMLGQAQLNAFLNAVQASDAKWKVVLNETPIQQYYGFPYDRWEGYAHERVELLSQLQGRGVKNLVFLTTDNHANFANVVRLRTLQGDSAPANAPAGPTDTPYNDYVTGPVATMTFNNEIDSTTGSPGNGKLLSQAFFKPEPPNGVGMFCAQGGVYSYAEVEASSDRLTISYKDSQGNTVVDVDGSTPCGPYTIPAQ
jgi:phosphodiesterase/alkaline phosphatase D-like protein